MFGIHRGAYLWVSLFAVLVGANTSTSSQSATADDRLKEIIAAARKEGQLSLVYGEGSVNVSNGVLSKGFNDYYGLNLDVRFTPGPSMPNMASTIIQQYQAHRPATTDIVVGYGNHMSSLIDVGAIQKGEWETWAPNIQLPGIASSEGAAVAIQSSTPGIAYNRDVFKGDDIPTSLQDMLNPKLKGRIAGTPYAASFDQVALGLWGKERTLGFVRKFADQIGGLIRCNEAERLASGEFDAFALTCSQGNGLRPASRGAPIGFTLASDAPIVVLLYLAIPANAIHPNAAKLWINYVLSPEAQRIQYDQDFADLHLLKGSRTAQLMSDLQAKGTKFALIDTDFYRNHQTAEVDAILGDLQKILRK